MIGRDRRRRISSGDPGTSRKSGSKRNSTRRAVWQSHRMRCIEINLARATARRQAIAEQLRALDMEVEILNAEDWQELTEQDYASVDTVARERQGRRALSSGMIAGAISHRRAFEGLLSGEADLAVTVEDDVTLSNRTSSHSLA